MNQKSPTSTTSHLTARQLRTAVFRLRDSEDRLRKHQAFLRAGGDIRWVIDTDVAKLFLAPREMAKYADLFGTHTPGAAPSASLSALAGLLADFIFGRRFRFDGPQSEQLERVILEPHTEEFDEVVQAIARRARDQSESAALAVNGGIVNKVNQLISDFTNNRTVAVRSLSQKDFVDKLHKTMSGAINILQPTGPMAELRRARDLLKERSLKYQADVPSLHELLSSSAVQSELDDRTEVWLRRYKDFLDEARRPNHDEIFHNRAVQRYRDARVLAALDWLNASESQTKARYVLLSGTEALLGLVSRLHRDRVDHAVYVVPPWAFLGNPWLFSRDLDRHELTADRSASDDHPLRWQRITDAVNFLARIPESDLDQNGDLVGKLLQEWQELEKMALPYLPVLATPPNVRDLARAIFSGDSLEAIEAQLYVALSEFFVLTAELGLVAYQEPVNGEFRRKPPPLRLAFYPAAETFICGIGARSYWDPVDGRINLSSINESLSAVKREQKAEEQSVSVPNFNYTLLLCFAVRYAMLGEWHACRILAGHARAVASVLNEAFPFVTGRDAAYLECYSRRLEAKKFEDLAKAREALGGFDAACQREQDAWRSKPDDPKLLQKCAELRFNPESEFELHRLRSQVEELLIEFSELMFVIFVEHEAESSSAQRVVSNAQKFVELQKNSLLRLALLR